MSSLKSWLKSLLPSYRAEKELSKKLNSLEEKLELRLNQMDAKAEYMFWLSQMKEGESVSDTKRRVFLAMPPAEQETRLVQQANLSLLRQLKQLCDANGIRFSLAFGTLLGAFRHQGFIPWDDDIDIAMLRVDFGRLRELLQTHPLLRLDIYFNINSFQFAKVKYRGNETFFVDVFILDSFEADESNAHSRYRELMQTGEDYIREIYAGLRQESITTDQLRIPVRNKAIESRLQNWYSETAERLGYYGKGSYLCFGIDNPRFIRNMGYFYKRDDLLPFVQGGAIFEGDSYDIFRNADAWLRNSFGDYWSIPRNITSGHKDFSCLRQEDLAFLRSIGLLQDGDASVLRRSDRLKIRF